MRNRTLAYPETNSRTRLATRRARVRPARRPSPQLISDGVTASYIHEISDRHRRRDADELWSVQPVLSPCGG
jgi:hypothetical protein